jgi:pimeloyl-ACP methyl ester carboxylesterase
MKYSKIMLAAFVFILFSDLGFLGTQPKLTPSQSNLNQATYSSQIANQCEALFSAETINKDKVFSSTGLRKFVGNKDRVLIFDYKAAQPGKPTMLFIHGLGDNLFSMQTMAELADRDGYGILRMDLYGHGETLKEYLRTHDNQLPDEFNYQDNVDDIAKMISEFNISKLTLVGHSYGGGIALKLSQILPPTRLHSVHALAPYVERIDKYISNSMRSPNLLIAATTQNMKNAMIPQKVVSSIMDPLFNFVRNMTAGLRTIQDLSNRYFRTDQTNDAWLDPAMDVYMYQTYRKYFLASMGKPELSMTGAQLAFLDLRVRAAIIVTKGIRTLDYLDYSIPLAPFTSRTQIIGGQNDALVSPQQLSDFCQRLKTNNYPYDFVEMDGPNASHLFPQLMPEQAYSSIQDYLKKHP